MAVRQIRVIGDEVLNKKCKPVKEMTPRCISAVYGLNMKKER